MPRDGFPTGVAEQLKWYVYRLIDPRNGETFYVGKGQGNRGFSPTPRENSLDTAKSEVEEREDATDLKMQRIKEINDCRTGSGARRPSTRNRRSEDVAYEVEAALIDAYPGLSNKVRGHGSKDYGSRHVEEISR